MVALTLYAIQRAEVKSGLITGVLDRRSRQYARSALLAIDEPGDLVYGARAAELLCQLVGRRSKHRSALTTTELASKRQDIIFPNACRAVTLIDRLTHHV